MGHVELFGGRCQVDKHRRVVAPGAGGLLHGAGVGYLAPDLERDVACGTVLAGGQAMASELEMVVNVGVAGQETLRMPR